MNNLTHYFFLFYRSQNYSIEAETLPLVQDNKIQAVALEHNEHDAWFPVRKSKRKVKELRQKAIN